jgi:hypothetical protein
MIKSGFNKRLLFRPFSDGFPQCGFTSTLSQHQPCKRKHIRHPVSRKVPRQNPRAANFPNYRFLTPSHTRFMFCMMKILCDSNYPFLTPQKKDSESRIPLSEF